MKAYRYWGQDSRSGSKAYALHKYTWVTAIFLQPQTCSNPFMSLQLWIFSLLPYPQMQQEGCHLCATFHSHFLRSFSTFFLYGLIFHGSLLTPNMSLYVLKDRNLDLFVNRSFPGSVTHKITCDAELDPKKNVNPK